MSDKSATPGGRPGEAMTRAMDGGLHPQYITEAAVSQSPIGEPGELDYVSVAFSYGCAALDDLELGLSDILVVDVSAFNRVRTSQLSPDENEMLSVLLGREVAQRPAGIRAQGADLLGLHLDFEDEQLAELAEMAGLSPYGSTWEDIKGLLGQMTWAWPRWLPNGLLTMLVAHQEAGKSILALRVAASFLRGDPWPDGVPFTGEPGHVLWVETEAGQGVNIERAESWGLPLNRILTVFDGEPLADVSLDDPEHQAKIAEKARLPVVRTVFVDSLSGGNRRDENASGMMQTTKWLGELARDTHKPVLQIHHLRKPTIFDGNRPTLHMVRGHTSVTQVARVVWAIDLPDPMDQDARRLSVIKYNVGRRPEPLGMRIAEGGVTFTGDAPDTPHTETQVDKAVDLLLALLDGGPWWSVDLEEEAKGAGLSWTTMKRAGDKVGIVKKRDGRLNKWSWSLPAREITV